MRHVRIRFHLLLTMSLLPFSGFLWADKALENSDSGQELLLSCKAFSEEAADLTGLACESYIRGYLAGAWGVNDVTASSLEEIQRKPSTWEDRAYHSRVGARPDLSSSTSGTYFCGPVDEAKKSILLMLANEGLSQIQSVQDLNIRIENTIKTICPSDKETGASR